MFKIALVEINLPSTYDQCKRLKSYIVIGQKLYNQPSVENMNNLSIEWTNKRYIYLR